MKLLLRSTVIGGLLFVIGCSNGGGKQAGVLGLPSTGEVAWTFVGHLDQKGTDFAGYGYLSHVDGLEDAQLFTGPARDETSAVFTVVVDAHATNRSRLSNLTVVNTQGTATVFFNPKAGASFANPASFRTGTAIDTANMTGQNALSINPDNRDQGILAASAEFHQTSTTRFDVGGGEHELGRTGLVLRMALNGPGKRTDPALPASTIEVAGAAIVAGAKV